MGAVKHRIEMTRQTGDLDHLKEVLGGFDRTDELPRELLQLAQQGEEVGRTEPVPVASAAEDAWRHVATDDASLGVATDAVIEADRGRLRQLLEKLYINAVEHGDSVDDVGPVVTVGVGGDGCLYVVNDGCGIPMDEPEEMFSSGYTTGRDGTGYGLTTVMQVVRAHGWEGDVTESHDSGARFEFRGVEYHDR